MNIMVTGGAGFIGSHFVRHLYQINNITMGKVVIYDVLTYAADLNRLSDIPDTFYELVIGDINNEGLVKTTLERFDITHVINFAAESHVDRSLASISPFVQTNVLGTIALLNVVSEFWRSTQEGYRDKFFVQISTDEVYGAIGVNQPPATETSELRPSNPYAATKASADQFVLAKFLNEKFPIMITRSNNNFGLDQHPEKFIPKIVNCLVSNQPIPVYGKGLQKRCWLSVTSHSERLFQLILKRPVGEIINIKGNVVLSNNALTTKIRDTYMAAFSIEEKDVSPIEYVEDRSGHDFFYHINDDKCVQLIGDRHQESIVDFIESRRVFQGGSHANHSSENHHPDEQK